MPARALIYHGRGGDPVWRLMARGAAAGAVAGLAFGAAQATLSRAAGSSLVRPLRLEASTVLGVRAVMTTYPLGKALAVGGLVHMGMSVGYGVLFVSFWRLLRSRVPRRSTSRGATRLAYGAAFGVALWAINMRVLSPLLYPWVGDRTPVLDGFITRLLFGLTQGAMLPAACHVTAGA